MSAMGKKAVQRSGKHRIRYRPAAGRAEARMTSEHHGGHVFRRKPGARQHGSADSAAAPAARYQRTENDDALVQDRGRALLGAFHADRKAQPVYVELPRRAGKRRQGNRLRGIERNNQRAAFADKF